MGVYQLAFAIFLGLTAERWVNGLLSAFILRRNAKKYKEESEQYFDKLLQQIDREMPPLPNEKLTVN